MHDKNHLSRSFQEGKSGKNKWLHPDIVGVHFPFDSYTDNTLKLFDVLKVNPYKLYSFEMKISLGLSNLRECYFQRSKKIPLTGIQ